MKNLIKRRGGVGGDTCDPDGNDDHVSQNQDEDNGKGDDDHDDSTFFSSRW